MGRYGDLNYERWAKTGFLLSIALFAVGAGAEFSAAAMHVTLPAWEDSLFVGMELFGTVGALLCPFVFGIVLPLTE